MVCRYEGGGEYEENLGRFLLRQHCPLRTANDTWLRVETAADRVTRCESQLMEQLDETEQTILTKLIRSQHDIGSITARENFILGFRLGVKMMAECMDEKDGDTTEVTDYG